MDLRQCTGDIVDAGLKVHTRLGPGLLERPYHMCLAYELRHRGHTVREQVAMPVKYKHLVIPDAYHADLIIDDAVIVEIKAVDRIHPVHEAQLLTYLKLSGLTVGLILNFSELLFKDGIRRLVNNYR